MAKALNALGVRITTLVVGVFLLLSFFQIPARAQFDDASGCEKVDISFVELFNPGNYFPLVPEGCGTISKDNANIDDAVESDLANANVAAALPLSAIPIILLRAYGALSSMVFYLFGFFLVFSGVQWIAGGVNPEQKAKALKQIQASVTAVVMIISAYVVVNTIAIVLGLQDIANQDVTSFFVP